MPDNPHPLKEAVIDLGTWVDRWRDEPGLEALVDSVREAWMDYVAGSGMFEIPNAGGKLTIVIPLRPRWLWVGVGISAATAVVAAVGLRRRGAGSADPDNK